MIVLAALCLTVGARAARVPFLWSWADNETLYSNLLTYLDGVRVEVYGEPFSFMLQKLETELKAAHKVSPYEWIGQTARFCNKVQAIYPAALAHSGTMVEDKYEHIRKCIVMLRDYPLHESTFADSEDGCPAPPAARSW